VLAEDFDGVSRCMFPDELRAMSWGGALSRAIDNVRHALRARLIAIDIYTRGPAGRPFIAFGPSG
jgi:hypothetical protein